MKTHSGNPQFLPLTSLMEGESFLEWSGRLLRSATLLSPLDCPLDSTTDCTTHFSYPTGDASLFKCRRSYDSALDHGGRYGAIVNHQNHVGADVHGHESVTDMKAKEFVDSLFVDGDGEGAECELVDGGNPKHVKEENLVAGIDVRGDTSVSNVVRGKWAEKEDR